jgi:hypothetical protein
MEKGSTGSSSRVAEDEHFLMDDWFDQRWSRLSGQFSANDKWRSAGFGVFAV